MFGHSLKWDSGYIEQRVLKMELPGRRKTPQRRRLVQQKRRQ